jgi:hypothetical protein
VPAVYPIPNAMDGLSSGYHLHSSLQHPAPHVSMRSLKVTTGRPVELARAERALEVREQRPALTPIQRETQPMHRLQN